MAPDKVPYQVVPIKYNPTTRALSLKQKDRYAGSTIDTNSVLIEVEGIPNDFTDAWLEFAVQVEKKDHTTFRPIGPLIPDRPRDLRYYIVEQFVLEAAFHLKKLPIQLVTRKENVVINSRNQITLEVSRSINALGTKRESYEHLLFKGDSFTWIKEFNYKEGSIVTYDGHIFISLCNCNIGNKPFEDSAYWKLVEGCGGGAKTKTLRFECDGTRSEWQLRHDMGTTNLIYSVMKTGNNEFVNPTVIPRDKNYVSVLFNRPYVGKYVINLISCEETAGYEQEIFCEYEAEEREEWDYNVGAPLPKYVQTYGVSRDETVGNEILGSVLQNPDTGYEELDVCFSEPVSGHSVIISPKDSNVYYFTNRDEVEIKDLFGKMYLVQMFDLESNDRLYGDVFNDGQRIHIKLNSLRTFCVVLVEPSEPPVRKDGLRMDWDHSLLTRDGRRKYEEPVAVQCYDSMNRLMYPAIYVDEKQVKVHYNEPVDGIMLVCGKRLSD